MEAKNKVIDIMLRQVGRTWECRVSCKLHDGYGLHIELDDYRVALKTAMDNLKCECLHE